MIDDAEQQAVKEVLKSGNLSQGEKVEEFEEKVRQYCGAKYAVAFSSCTAGLYLVLNNKLRGYVDTLAIPAFTFPAAHRICDYANYGDTWIADVDVNENTYNMDINALDSEIAVETLSGIVPIHQFGLPCDMDKINEIAKENELFVLEDAACALGSEYKGERIGKHGTAVFSFHGRKIITTGEGGMVVTDDEELYEKVLEGRQYGRNRYGDFVSSGLNFKMADINAAIGLAQMEKIDEIISSRRSAARTYYELLTQLTIDNYDWYNYYSVPHLNEVGTNWQSYVIRILEKPGVPTRNEVLQRMRANGIEVQVGSYDNSGGRCEISKNLALTTLALPIYPTLNEIEINYITETLRKCLST